MAKVLLKKSSVSGNIPDASVLSYGEVAINFVDGKLYYKNSSNEVKNFIDSDGISSRYLRSDIDGQLSATLTVDSDMIVGGVLKGPEQFYIDPAPYDSDAGTVIIRGNLTVQGTQTILNTEILSIDDKNIILADSAPDSAAADGGGISLGGANATFTYNASSDAWVLNKAPYYNSNRVLVDGDDINATSLNSNSYDDIISEATALAIALG